ncbi:MAG: ABC1 kinase family protein [Dehalococcoidia bacterium]
MPMFRFAYNAAMNESSAPVPPRHPIPDTRHPSQRERTQLLFARVYRTVLVMETALAVGSRYFLIDRQTKHAPPEERARRMDAQHARSAERLATLAGRLRGLLTKSGQYLSARPDLLPEPYIEPLARLQDAVPPRPFALIARQIERELGRSPETVFASINWRPVASASLAQVHRATLRDGRDVAVKVQYPGIEGLVRADLRNLGLIVDIVGRIWPKYDFRALYREIRRMVPQELDFHHEAANAERIAADLADRDDLLIPTILHEYSGRRVLTMSYVDGVKISDVGGIRRLGLDPAVLAERVVSIFGDQVVGHGFFHGDPHPGNVFVLPDGRIALLDFGQALALPPDVQRAFASLSLAAAERNPAGMVAAIRAIGFELPREFDTTYMQMATQVLSTISPDHPPAEPEADAAAVNTQMARGFRNISLDHVSGEALFVFRTQGLLRGLRTRLGAPGPIVTTWAPYARRLLAASEAVGNGQLAVGPNGR